MGLAHIRREKSVIHGRQRDAEALSKKFGLHPFRTDSSIMEFASYVMPLLTCSYYNVTETRMACPRREWAPLPYHFNSTSSSFTEYSRFAIRLLFYHPPASGRLYCIDSWSYSAPRCGVTLISHQQQRENAGWRPPPSVASVAIVPFHPWWV